MFPDVLTVIVTVGTDFVNIHHVPNVRRAQHDFVSRMVEDEGAPTKVAIRVRGTSIFVQLMVEEDVVNPKDVTSRQLEVQIVAPVMEVVVGVLQMVVESQHKVQRNFVLNTVGEKSAHILGATK